MRADSFNDWTSRAEGLVEIYTSRAMRFFAMLLVIPMAMLLLIGSASILAWALDFGNVYLGGSGTLGAVAAVDKVHSAAEAFVAAYDWLLMAWVIILGTSMYLVASSRINSFTKLAATATCAIFHVMLVGALL